MILARKLLRQLRVQRAQVLALSAVCALGALLFVASYSGYLDLSSSYRATFARLSLADLHIAVTRISPAQLDALRASAATRTADARFVTELPVHLRADDARLTLRLVSLPESGQPKLDRLLVLDGHLPAGAREIVLEKHVADFHRVKVGDVVEVRGGNDALTVVGIVASPEYLWVARSADDLMPTPDAFGVGYVTRAGARSIAEQLTATTPSLAASPAIALAAENDDAGNELLLEPNNGREAALAAVNDVLGARPLSVTRVEDLPGPKLLRLDVDGLKDMALFFPLFFLAVASFIVLSIVSRLVDSEAPLIGTLRALGASRRTVLLHYAAFAELLAGGGAILGALVGVPAGAAMTSSYAHELGIPFVTTQAHGDLCATAIAVSLVVGALAAARPAWRAASLNPAAAMRGLGPRASVTALRLLRALPHGLPQSVRLSLRNIVRRPFRSVATAAGVAAALTLVIVTNAVLDSTRKTIDIMFSEQQKGDLRVDLLAPTPAAIWRSQLASLEGVKNVEVFLTVPVAISAANERASTLMQALPEPSPLVGAVDLSLGEIAPAPGSALVPRPLAKHLSVHAGDEIDASVAGTAASSSHIKLRVQRVIDVPVGQVVTANMTDAQRGLSLEGLATSAVLSVDPSAADEVRRSLEDDPDVARVADARSLRESVAALMGLAWFVLAIMLAMSVVLASAILFNTAVLNILERGRDLATMRALGLSMRSLSVMLSLENGTLALVGVALGIPASMWLVRRVLHLFSSDLMSFPVVLSPSIFVVAIVGALLVLLVAQAPPLRSVARMSLASALRLRR